MQWTKIWEYRGMEGMGNQAAPHSHRRRAQSSKVRAVMLFHYNGGLGHFTDACGTAASGPWRVTTVVKLTPHSLQLIDTITCACHEDRIEWARRKGVRTRSEERRHGHVDTDLVPLTGATSGHGSDHRGGVVVVRDRASLPAT
jgi:hypothetical protein